MEKVINIVPLPDSQVRYVLSVKEYESLVARANATEDMIQKRVEDLWEDQSPHDLTITLRLLHSGGESIVGEAEVWRVSLFAYRDDNDERREQRKMVASKIRELISDWYDKEFGDVRKLQKEAHQKMRRARLLWRTYWIAGIVGLLTALILKFV